MNTMFENSHAAESPAVSLETVLRTATTSLGVPEWFAAHWHRQMCMMGWVNKNGRAIYAKNWQRNLLQWWKWANDREKAQIEAAYLAEQKSAAEEADDPEPKIEITAHHWYECQRTCANFKKGKCIWGARHPAVLYARNDGFTDRCLHFEPLPLEWQWAWVLEFPESVEKAKLQHVKDYFAAHPEELAEARWRNDHAEPTEAECAEVRAWLAWVARAKARGKKRKEAGKN